MGASGQLYRKNKPVRLAQILITLFFGAFCISILFPLVLTVIVSFSSEMSVLQYGYSFFPKKWSLEAYKFLFQDNALFNAYLITIIVTVTGTSVSLVCSSLAGFVLSLKKIKYAGAVAFFFYLPTVVGAGLVAWYYNIAVTLNLRNNIFVLILPNLIGAYNLFLIRNYYKTIPDTLVESAEIDGAGPLRIFAKVVFPLAVPITATIALFVSLGYWNDWYLASWFIDYNHGDLYPLQFFLYRLWYRFTNTNINSSGAAPVETVYVATMFVTMGPIVLIYPFVQKYFIKGIMMGAVKG